MNAVTLVASAITVGVGVAVWTVYLVEQRAKPRRQRDILDAQIEAERFCGMIDDPLMSEFWLADEVAPEPAAEPNHQPDAVPAGWLTPLDGSTARVTPTPRVHTECFDNWIDGKRPCARCEQVFEVKA